MFVNQCKKMIELSVATMILDDKLFNNFDDLNNTIIRKAAEIVHK